jgi:FkbM family methyltransferase
MDTAFFLYKRLSQWITCKFRLPEGGEISLANKYEVASFQDVFCHPFYWQVFQYLDRPPQTIVDCGSHCGHFSILADICIRSKFGKSTTDYILVEPNPYLIPVITKNVADAGMHERVNIERGLLGTKQGSSTLWIDPRNYLATGMEQKPNTRSHEVPFIDLAKSIGQKQIDLLKLDIEGGEYQFIPENLEIFQATNLVFMELHEADREAQIKILDLLASVGLKTMGEPLPSYGQQLIICKR